MKLDFSKKLFSVYERKNLVMDSVVLNLISGRENPSLEIHFAGLGYSKMSYQITNVSVIYKFPSDQFTVVTLLIDRTEN